MKVILREDVENLGAMGSVVNVSDGYGRNYLLPRNLAVEASAKNIKQMEHEKKVILEKAKKTRKTSEELVNQLSKVTLSIEAQAGEGDKLFGSVTSKDIAEALAKQGFEIDKRRIVIQDEPIKRLGQYSVHIKLHPELTATVNLEVHSTQKQENSDEVQEKEK